MNAKKVKALRRALRKQYPKAPAPVMRALYRSLKKSDFVKNSTRNN